MTRFTATHKALLAGVAVVAFGVAAILTTSATPNAQPGTEEQKPGPSDHTMFGGTTSRNMVNLVDKNVPDKLDAQLWKAPLGSRAYGGPIISQGKIFVGTNNELPRNKRDFDKAGDPIDKGILMCFDEKT